MNGDGHISMAELRTVAATCLAAADKVGDGEALPAEVAAALDKASRRLASNIESARRAFNLADKSG